MRGGYSTDEMLSHRNRCRVAQIAVDDTSYVQYNVCSIYTCFNILIIGKY